MICKSDLEVRVFDRTFFRLHIEKNYITPLSKEYGEQFENVDRQG